MKGLSRNGGALMLGAATATCLFVGIAKESWGELPRPEYRRLQRQAPEEMKIAVLRVNEAPVGESPRERDRVGRAFRLQLGDIGRHALLCHSFGRLQVCVKPIVRRKPRKPGGVAAAGLEPRPVRPVGARSAISEEASRLDAYVPVRAVARGPVGDRRTAGHAAFPRFFR